MSRKLILVCLIVYTTLLYYVSIHQSTLPCLVIEVNNHSRQTPYHENLEGENCVIHFVIQLAIQIPQRQTKQQQNYITMPSYYRNYYHLPTTIETKSDFVQT